MPFIELTLYRPTTTTTPQKVFINSSLIFVIEPVETGSHIYSIHSSYEGIESNYWNVIESPQKIINSIIFNTPSQSLCEHGNVGLCMFCLQNTINNLSLNIRCTSSR